MACHVLADTQRENQRNKTHLSAKKAENYWATPELQGRHEPTGRPVCQPSWWHHGCLADPGLDGARGTRVRRSWKSDGKYSLGL